MRNGGDASKGQRRWDEIIHAAAHIFYEKGYEATSLQDIADAVGLLKGSVYYYIETKEDLLFELVIRAQDVWQGILEEPDAVAASSAPERMREFIGRWMRLREREREWGIVAEREFPRLSAPQLKRVIAGRKQFSGFVEGIVTQGMESGDFDPTLDRGLATAMVFELVKASHRSRRPRSEEELGRLADAYSAFVVRGLGARVDWR